MRARTILFLVPLALSAQKISYSTGTNPQELSAIVWRVTACNPSGALAVNLPQGLLFQHLALHGAKPLLYSEEIQAFNVAPGRSIPGRAVEWAGWTMVGGGALMQFKVITAKESIKNAMTIGGGVIAVMVPLVRQKIPQISPLRNELIGPWLTVPSGGCGQGVMLSSEDTGDFEVTL